MRHIRIINGQGFTESELDVFHSAIRQNAIDSMRELVRGFKMKYRVKKKHTVRSCRDGVLL